MKNVAAIFLIALLCNVSVYAQKKVIIEKDFFEMSLEELMKIEVTTASRQAESIFKTPVPITVITRAMIDAIGARNLKEVLTTYVPGMTAVEDHNEMNVSMRGIYASSQQKILFLLNGQRLNSRAYSMANPDYGINLDKVKQIEVVRGPGSSLYGNVSLTGVVNIITLDGEEFDGTQVKLSAGNYGQLSTSLVTGAGFGENKSFLAWAHFYKADGENRSVNADDDFSSATTQDGVAYLGAVPGNFDIGVQAQLNKFDFLFNNTRGKIQQPFSDGGGTGEIYHADDYNFIMGEGPGLGQENRHLKIGYTSQINRSLDFNVDLYADQSSLILNMIAVPSIVRNASVYWWDRDLGGVTQLTYDYDKGNVLVGAQVDWMNVYDSHYSASINTPGVIDTFLDTNTPLLETGEEIIYSGFMQWKHNLNSKLLLNAGFRYDNKQRHEGKNVDALSPRLALIYEASEKQIVKLSYSKSFVDAPYWYRYNSLASYSGSRDLNPEILQAVQLTLDSKLSDSKIFNNLNIFYQNLADIIYRDPLAGPNDPKYRNAGYLKSWGIEEQAMMKFGKLDLTVNGTYQAVLGDEDYSVDERSIANVPTFTTNIIGTYRIMESLFVNVSAKYLSSQFAPIVALGSDTSVPDNYIDEALIFNAGINFQKKGFTADLRVRNLFDTKYYQGGSTRYAYPQEGRWFTASLIYKFNNN